MKIYKRLFESIKIKNSIIGTQSRQEDMRLAYEKDDNNIGSIDYSMFDNKIYIKMISINNKFKRKGYGEKLILALQNLYPKIEIDWGMITGEGIHLYNKVKNKMYKDTRKEKKIKQLLRKYKNKLKYIDILIKQGKFDTIDDLRDEKEDIENILWDDYNIDYRDYI